MSALFRSLVSLTALLLFGIFGPAKADINYSNCNPDTRMGIEVGLRQACELLSKSTGLSARQRATILFQLGITEQVHPANGSGDILANIATERSWYDRSIEADPTFVLAYVYAGETLEGDQKGKAIEYAERGLEHVPNNGMLMAKLAILKISGGEKNQAEPLCDRAMAALPVELATANYCGDAYAMLELWEKSYSAFETASKLHVPGTSSRYGIAIQTIPVSGMARALASMDSNGDQNGDKNGEAADLLTAYLQRKDIGFEARILSFELSQYQEKIGKFSDAAVELDKRAAGVDPVIALPMRMRQMIDFARAGKVKEARDIAELIYGNAPLKFILKLQVKLRNAHFDDLKITGKYDDQTKTTLEKCFLEATCFSEIAGKRI
jgi:tetratricopeptide (TPR) repeat protein